MSRTVVFAGIHVSPLNLSEFLNRARASLATCNKLTITFLNPDYARRALLSDQLRQDINTFDLVLVDGNGVRLLTPLFGFTVPVKLDTDSVVPPLFAVLAEHQARLFLFGCAPGVADRAGLRLVETFPGVHLAGTEHGFHDRENGHPGLFRAEDYKAVVAAINAAEVDYLMVSLPTPLQQRWVAYYRDQLDVPMVMTAGSYLDHLAEGSGARLDWYPGWATTLRLNWFYRLMREPRRLWRRYTVEIAHLAWLVIRARLRLGRES